MSFLKIHFLGTGDAFGSGGKLNTCFYVKATEHNFLIDCGATSLVAMKKQGIKTNDVDFIIISHFHGDHYGGLPFFLLDAGILAQRTKPLTIVSPPGIKEKVIGLMDLLYPGLQKRLESLPVKYLNYQPKEKFFLDGLEITAFPVLHSKETLPHALRMEEDGKTICYSGDSEWTKELIQAADNADIFICECNFFKKHIPGHLNYKTIMENMDKLTCKKIILTHIGEEMIENINNVELEIAEDGKFVSF